MSQAVAERTLEALVEDLPRDHPARAELAGMRRRLRQLDALLVEVERLVDEAHEIE